MEAGAESHGKSGHALRGYWRDLREERLAPRTAAGSAWRISVSDRSGEQKGRELLSGDHSYVAKARPGLPAWGQMGRALRRRCLQQCGPDEQSHRGGKSAEEVRGGLHR